MTATHMFLPGRQWIKGIRIKGLFKSALRSRAGFIVRFQCLKQNWLIFFDWETILIEGFSGRSLEKRQRNNNY